MEKEAKKIQPDLQMAESLQKTSINKAYSSEQLELNEQTAAAKISLYYDSARELLEAIALKKGFKIYNHVCYTAFLKEILKESNLAEEFDALRKIRNDINYYGKEITLEETKAILMQLKKARQNLIKLLT